MEVGGEAWRWVLCGDKSNGQCKLRIPYTPAAIFNLIILHGAPMVIVKRAMCIAANVDKNGLNLETSCLSRLKSILDKGVWPVR